MKGFVIKIGIFISIFIGTYLYLVHRLSQGYVDDYYNKLTQEAGSLIIGLSRADQGIVPQIIESELKYLEIARPLVNFATNQSSYGEVYLNAIKNKLGNTTKPGIFLLSVSPANFTIPTNKTDNSVFKMDKETVLGKINNYKTLPNYDYIINCYGFSLYNALYNTTQWNHQITHENGWNEFKMHIANDTIKTTDINLWKSEIKKTYIEKLKTEQISKYRINSFIKILTFLKTKGYVILVRIPCDSDIYNMEDTAWKQFNKQFDSISKKHHVPYFKYNQLNNNYKTYDGSHLESESAKQFTKLLVADIKQYITKHQKPSTPCY